LLRRQVVWRGTRRGSSGIVWRALRMGALISVPSSIVHGGMCDMTTSEMRLSRQHVGAPQSLNRLVLVGFSNGSRSPNIGIRVSAIALGRCRIWSRGPARRWEMFGTHIYRAIVSRAIVSRGVQVCPGRQTTMLRVAAGPRVSGACRRPSRSRRVEPIRSRRRCGRGGGHSRIFPVVNRSRPWCVW